jgi:DNA-binding beta-propeller fold protein YncE
MVLLAAGACVLAGCASGKFNKSADKQAAKAEAKPDKLLWPALPDQPRFKFAGILRAASDIVQESDDVQLMRKLTGRSPADVRPVIDKPAGIAVRSGLVYVAEPAAKAITVFDMQRRKLFRFGTREPNSLKRPQAVAVDRDSQVYVLDSFLRKIMVYDQLGLFLRSIDLQSGYTNPVSVGVSPDGSTVYVVDRGDLASSDHKVVAYSVDGREKFRLGPRGREPGKFNIPLAVAVAEDNTLYVADTGNFRVQAFDGEGKFKLEFGGLGVEPGNFSRPRSIAVDPGGNVYVGDAGFSNVQIFNAKGELLMPLGGLSRDPGPGNYALLAGIAVDEGGRLYINDHFFKKIEVFLPLSEQEGRQLAAGR